MTKVTSIPSFNLESDVFIFCHKKLLSNRSYKKFLITTAKDYYTGGNIKNLSNFLKNKLKQIVNNTSIPDDVLNKFKKIYVADNQMEDFKNRLAGIITAGFFFELVESPLDIAKQLDSDEVKELANEFTSNRGKQKLINLLGLKESENKTEPKLIVDLRDVVENGYRRIKDPVSKKIMTVDSYTASLVTKVYDAIKDQDLKDKLLSFPLPVIVNKCYKLI